MHVIKRVHHRYVDVLADSGFLAIVKRESKGGEGMNTAADIGDADADGGRRPIRLAGHVHDSRKGLRYEIITGLVGERAVASESRQRSHNQSRVDLLQRIVIEPALLHHARTEVLHHYIYLRHQFAQDLHRFGLFEKQAEAFLAPVLLDEIAAASGLDRGKQTRRIAHRGDLDLDYVGSHFGH